jgi:hypothetical protein
MKHSHLQFQIAKLQRAKLNTTVEVIATIALALFVSSILPILLVRYIYANQQLFEQPALLEYIPIVAFVIGAGYGLFAIIVNIIRSKKIAQLSKELETEMRFAEMDGCCGGACGSVTNNSDDDWADMDSFEELDKMVDEVIAQNESKKSSKKGTGSNKIATGLNENATGAKSKTTASKKKTSKK